jgi:hypothetical protein
VKGTDNFISYYTGNCNPHQWCKGYRAPLECGRSWLDPWSSRTENCKIGISFSAQIIKE